MATLSLYTAVIPSYLQVLRSVAGLLGKAEGYCSEKGIAPEELLQTRLAPDMLPFAYQIRATSTHSQGAIDAVRKGVFVPDRSPPPGDFPALHARVADTLIALEGCGSRRGERLRRSRHAVCRRRTAHGLYRREFFTVVLAAEFLFSCRHGLRHSALEGAGHRQAGFHRPTAYQDLMPIGSGRCAGRSPSNPRSM
jgi:hypothetical protein